MKKFISLAVTVLLLTALLLAACSSAAPGSSGGQQSELPPLQIASKPMTEQMILVEMLKAILETHTDYTVELTKGIGGGTSNIQPAMERGDFHMYPEYTSTGWEFVLKQKGGVLSDEEMFEQLQQQYQEQFGFEWVGRYGFGDQFGLAVRKQIADEHGISTYSDLAPLTPELVFAAEPDFFERDDGFDSLCATYGYKFRSTKDIDIGLKYNAINAGEVDVIEIATTDGQLAAADVTVLADDKKFFQSYYCYTVVRQDILEQYPGLREALMKMEGIINEQEMIAMNSAVDLDKKEDVDVALEFLRSKGIIE